MYGVSPAKGYAVSVPDIKQSRFGKSLTSRYRKSTGWLNTYYVVAGAARMETDDKIVIGELNRAATWINGRLEMDKDTNRILYREYDIKGNKIQNSTQEFVDFEWLEHSKVKEAEKKLASRAKKATPAMKKPLTDKKKAAGKKKMPSAEKKKPAAEKEKPAAEKKKSAPKIYTESSSKVGDGASSSTIQLTDSEADSLLKNFGINLESIRGNGTLGRTITVRHKTTTVGSSR